jgi:hypothetical protein
MPHHGLIWYANFQFETKGPYNLARGVVAKVNIHVGYSFVVESLNVKSAIPSQMGFAILAVNLNKGGERANNTPALS